MKYHDTESLVVLEDQSNSKKFKSFRDIETALPVVRSYFPIKGEVLIKEGTKSFELEPENPSYKVEWWTEDMWDSQPEGPPKDNDEIFADFFDEYDYNPLEDPVVSKVWGEIDDRIWRRDRKYKINLSS